MQKTSDYRGIKRYCRTFHDDPLSHNMIYNCCYLSSPRLSTLELASTMGILLDMPLIGFFQISYIARRFSIQWKSYVQPLNSN